MRAHPAHCPLRVVCAAVVLCVITSGCSGGSSGPSKETDIPSDTSAAGITAFVQSDSYTSGTWRSETDAPRAAATSVSPHGRVRVWLDQAAVAAHGGALGPGAMAVKEMASDTDQPVGYAAILQTGSAVRDVVYWCWGPAGRCADGEPDRTASDPLYGGAATPCAGCHGGLIFTKLP